ncbi:GNAT family N-acetyltransferase [Pedosphaera parvula]|uniref:GCN5-related N-acetyltransferase n=1 Tax=Pedosphaera parvula (strain Ellin514) TaxID=320771 RepID=B9XD39_PEDPL|nr:GNAT family N-acetyltransferase [Pedosphaera parvula]EEF62385.1 GCN5-related N-acetyltransferase [Pedosphaera parvula Ellin514]
MIGRLLSYASRHGVRATLGRARVSLGRAATGNRMVLFYCDLGEVQADEGERREVERKGSEKELSPQELARITNAWRPEETRRLMRERFERGATLWLLKLDGEIAAFGWTMAGGTMEPHYFPLGERDVHLFDFFVFPEFRGKRLNPGLVNHILGKLAEEGKARAFIEAAEWNVAQLSSLSRTRFRRFGAARKMRVLGRTLVVWSREK